MKYEIMLMRDHQKSARNIMKWVLFKQLILHWSNSSIVTE